jgi:putative hydrolase of the HAD superfamily
MHNTNIRAVFLDAGNTLFTERTARPALYNQIALSHGGLDDVDAMRSAMTSAIRDLPTSVEGHFRYSLAWFRAFNERVLSQCGVGDDAQATAHEELVSIYSDPATYQVFDEVPEVLAALAEREVQVGVVSNWSEHLPELLEALGICESIDFVVTSADLRSEKPERAIFERALFRAGAAADEAVHVGDHFERDVRGALNAGMRAVLVDRCVGDPSDREGVPVIGDLRDLPILLDAAVRS